VALHSELLGIIGRFLLISQSPFWCGDAAATAVFTLIEEYRKMIDPPLLSVMSSIVSRENLELIIAMWAILNNLIDVVRVGAHVHLRPTPIEVVEGIVEAVDALSVAVGNRRFLISSLVEIWAIPVQVDLSVITDFVPFVAIFTAVCDDNDCFRVFRLAALNSFLRVPRFLESLPNDSVPEPPEPAFFRGADLYDFTHLLSHSFIRFPVFSIVSTSRPVPLVLDSAPRFAGSILLLSTERPGDFASSPMSLHASFRFELSSDTEFSLGLFFTSEFRALSFVFSETAITRIVLDYSPERSEICYDSGMRSGVLRISPGFVMAYFNVRLPAMSLCDVSYAFGSYSPGFSIHNSLSDELEFSDTSGLQPLTDSSFFNSCSFRSAARALSAWLEQANYFSCAAAGLAQLSSRAALHGLAVLTPFPLTTALCSHGSVWGIDGLALRRAITEAPLDFAELERVLSYPCRLTNRQALPVHSGIRVGECVLITETMIRFLDQSEMIADSGILLPFSAVHESIIGRLVSLRCFFVLCLERGKRPSWAMRDWMQHFPHGRSVLDACEQLFPDGVDARFPADFPFSLAFRGQEGIADWKFFHSATIALCEQFDPATFAQLPFSSRFTYETVAFVSDHVHRIRDGDLLTGFALGLGFPEVDPVRSFIEEFFDNTTWLAAVRADPALAFVTLRCTKATERLVFEFVGRLPLVSLFLFVKWLYGWGLVRPKKFAVLSVGDENLIVVSSRERALFIGAFTSAARLATAFLTEVEKSAEIYFVCD
jgi:hypothetical protein